MRYRLAHQNSAIPDDESVVEARTVEPRFEVFGGHAELDQQRLLLAAASRHLLP